MLALHINILVFVRNSSSQVENVSPLCVYGWLNRLLWAISHSKNSLKSRMYVWRLSDVGHFYSNLEIQSGFPS